MPTGTRETVESLSSATEENSMEEKSLKENSLKPIPIEHYFSKIDVHPFDELEWERRTATITDENGEVVFEQQDVEVPRHFSQLATKVVVSKYFYGELDTEERETSFKHLVHRVTHTIAGWGLEDGLFDSKEQADIYYRELTWLCVNQYAAFNSPVWFNVGLYHVNGIAGSKHNYHWDPQTQTIISCENTYEYPQGSACFIQSVDDTMEGIMSLAAREAMLFKHGSGTGTDLSTLRSSREKLSGGGNPSGPLSFMRVFDQIAAVVKSGGKTRRAAKMQSLKIHHPDIKDFICCKAEEERKAWALIEQGYDGSYNGQAYSSIMFQNANLSVRVTDEFMQAVESDSEFSTIAVTTNEPVDTYKAGELMNLIADGTRICGDPGMQYDTTINHWHTCPRSGRINASNPCSEYMFMDDSACNLASLNLMRFRRDDGSFDIESFRRAIRILIIAQELLVDHGSYPDEKITRNSHEFRPLGLGYANLGSLVMSLGLPYDSDEARAIAGAITAVMTGTAYTVSAELARSSSPFDGFELNREPMLNVINLHRQAVGDIDPELCPDDLLKAAHDCWEQAYTDGSRYGFRNAQASVLAPTGTIGFMMDCDTTGIEPDIALVKYKLLAGGGMLKIVNNTVKMALKQLGYNPDQIRTIVNCIEEDDTIETAEALKPEHLAIFDCAFKAAKGKRSIHYLAHIKMMAAVQPFISGAISKTVNMPHEATTDQIETAYMTGWKQGLKALAVYRDGSKRSQPLSTTKDNGTEKTDRAAQTENNDSAKTVADNNGTIERRPQRIRLPQTRRSITHKFDVAGHEGYLTVGLYEDGTPGELFITMAKEGSTVGGLMDAFGTCISMALQYGVPMETLVDKFSHARFEPSGMTSNRDIPIAKSLIDYIARWLGMTFLPGYREANVPNRNGAKPESVQPLWPKNGNTDQDTKTNKAEKLGHISNRIGELIDIVNHSGPEIDSQTDPQTDSQTNSQTNSQTDSQTDSRGLQIQTFNRQFTHFQSDAPVCDVCGSITVRNGNCYRCHNCGASHGCS